MPHNIVEMRNINARDESIERLKECVLKFLKAENLTIILFGSRARKTETTFSDIDIGVIPKGEFDRREITLLREYVENLNIPYKVDIVDFSSVSEDFKKEAMKKAEIWKD